MTTDGELPGTYRVADGRRVVFADALAAWLPLAYGELLTTAEHYHAVITYGELSERVQELSGIRTRMLLANWIGQLLGQVAARAKASNEPPLTSVCVHQDGTIGEGYAGARSRSSTRLGKTSNTTRGSTVCSVIRSTRRTCPQTAANPR